MTEILRLKIHGLPPTLNNMYRSSGTHRYKKNDVAEWQEDIAELMQRQWGCYSPPYSGRAAVVVKFTVKTKRGWDIDNRLKALLDCLELGGILNNDNQIDSLQVSRYVGNEDSTEITLLEYKGVKV